MRDTRIRIFGVACCSAIVFLWFTHGSVEIQGACIIAVAIWLHAEATHER